EPLGKPRVGAARDEPLDRCAGRFRVVTGEFRVFEIRKQGVLLEPDREALPLVAAAGFGQRERAHELRALEIGRFGLTASEWKQRANGYGATQKNQPEQEHGYKV